MSGDSGDSSEATVSRASRSALCYGLAAVAGALAWWLTVAAAGKREAWDSPLYFSAAYPLLGLVCGVCGWLAPQRVWRWGMAAMLAQAVIAVIRDPDASLLPIGLIVFGALSLPLSAVAALGAWLARRSAARKGG